MSIEDNLRIQKLQQAYERDTLNRQKRAQQVADEYSWAKQEPKLPPTLIPYLDYITNKQKYITAYHILVNASKVANSLKTQKQHIVAARIGIPPQVLSSIKPLLLTYANATTINANGPTNIYEYIVNNIPLIATLVTTTSNYEVAKDLGIPASRLSNLVPYIKILYFLKYGHLDIPLDIPPSMPIRLFQTYKKPEIINHLGGTTTIYKNGKNQRIGKEISAPQSFSLPFSEQLYLEQLNEQHQNLSPEERQHRQKQLQVLIDQQNLIEQHKHNHTNNQQQKVENES